MKGYNLKQPRCIPLHSLTVSLTQSYRLFYNATIQYTIVLQFLPFIKGMPWENTMAFPKPLARKSPIIDQVMTLKLQHFTRHFSLNFLYGGAAREPPLGGGSQNSVHIPPRPL